MKRYVLLATPLFVFCAISTKAQNSSPYWSLAGNNNASSSAKLGTTNADPLNLTTNNVTRLRIATDGSVGIGTTSPQQRFHVEGTSNQAIFVNTSALGSTSGSGQIGYAKATPSAPGQRLGYFLVGSRGGAENNYNTAGMAGYSEGAWTSTSRPTYLTFETTVAGATARQERVRITSDGNVGIGTPSAGNKLVVTDNTGTRPTAVIENLYNSTTYNDGLYIYAGTSDGLGSSPSWYTAFFRPDGAIVGSISQADANSVSYNTTSDKRLKANIRETKFGLADVNKIQVKDYTFIGSRTQQTGFLAQQLYEVFPAAVSKGGEDPKLRPWMVDYGRITPLLVKAVQELDVKTKEIDALRAEITELRNMVLELKNGRNNVTALSPASLETAIPNPAKGFTLVRYYLPDAAANARLTLVNTKGQLVKTLGLNSRGAGQVNLDTATLPAGTYTYTLWVDGQQNASKQLVVTK